MRFALVTLVTLLSLAIAGPVAAQTKDPIQPVTVFNMEESLIEGADLQKPDVVILKRAPIKFRSLIQIRKTFAPELLASARTL